MSLKCTETNTQENCLVTVESGGILVANVGEHVEVLQSVVAATHGAGELVNSLLVAVDVLHVAGGLVHSGLRGQRSEVGVNCLYVRNLLLVGSLSHLLLLTSGVLGLVQTEQHLVVARVPGLVGHLVLHLLASRVANVLANHIVSEARGSWSLPSPDG